MQFLQAENSTLQKKPKKCKLKMQITDICLSKQKTEKKILDVRHVEKEN